MHTVGRVHVHSLTGDLVLHWLPTPKWDDVTGVSFSKLAPQDCASAEQLLSVSLLKAVGMGRPAQGLGTTACSQIHARLEFWSGEGTRCARCCLHGALTPCLRSAGHVTRCRVQDVHSAACTGC